MTGKSPAFKMLFGKSAEVEVWLSTTVLKLSEAKMAPASVILLHILVLD